MDRSDWISASVALLAIWLTWYIGGAKAAIACGILGAIILGGVILFKRDRKSQASPAASVQQTISPVVTQNANPVINVNVGSESQPAPRVPSPAPRAQPNIKFVEAKSTSIHSADGKLYESPQGLGDFRVAVACFRNDGIVGQTVQQPHVTAHLIYKDFAGHEIANVDRGVWLQEYKDAVHLTMGAKRGVIIMLLTNQGTLKRLQKESYMTEHSWMSGGPSFRVVDDIIPEGVATIEVNLLDVDKGECLTRVKLRVDDSRDQGLPRLALVSAVSVEPDYSHS